MENNEPPNPIEIRLLRAQSVVTRPKNYFALFKQFRLGIFVFDRHTSLHEFVLWQIGGLANQNRRKSLQSAPRAKRTFFVYNMLGY